MRRVSVFEVAILTSCKLSLLLYCSRKCLASTKVTRVSSFAFCFKHTPDSSSKVNVSAIGRGSDIPLRLQLVWLYYRYSWSGRTRGLDDKVVKRVRISNLSHRFQQIFSKRAANAAIGKCHDLFFDSRNELFVDVNFAHVINDDGYLQTLSVVKQGVQRGSLACIRCKQKQLRELLEQIIPAPKKPDRTVTGMRFFGTFLRKVTSESTER